MSEETTMNETQERRNIPVPSDMEKELAAHLAFGGDERKKIWGLLEKMSIQEDKTTHRFSVPACNTEG